MLLLFIRLMLQLGSMGLQMELVRERGMYFLLSSSDFHICAIVSILDRLEAITLYIYLFILMEW